MAAISAGRVSVRARREVAKIAAGMEAQRGLACRERNAAGLQVALGERTGERLRHGEQAAGGVGRAGCRRGLARRDFGLRLGLRPRQAEEAPRLVGNVPEFDEAATFADDVEQVAIFGRRLVDPVAGWALRRVFEPDMHRPARRVADIADHPVVAAATAGREIFAAHRLAIFSKATRQLGGRAFAGHG